MSGQSNRKTNATIEDAHSQGYKRPIGSVNNPGTVRIPIHTPNQLIQGQPLDFGSQIIPPVTTNPNAIIVAQKKRPVVKINGIHF
jgi:hypothetical protein